MGIIRPVLTNFRLGEVDPRLAGRVDLGLAVGAADKIENAYTIDYGGVYKRGGYEYKAQIDAVAGNNYRIIPWSINDTVDVLVVLSDRKIVFFDTTSGDFFRNSGNRVEITSIAFNGVGKDVYSENDIYDVQYVTSKNVLYMVHKNYPPLYIRIEKSGDTFGVSYSAFDIISNLLVTPEPKTKDVSVAEFSSATVISLLKQFVNNNLQNTFEEKIFTAADGVEGTIYIAGSAKTVTQIKIRRDSILRKAVVTYNSPGANYGSSWSYTITESTNNTILNNALRRYDPGHASEYCQYTGSNVERWEEEEYRFPIFWDRYKIFNLTGTLPENIRVPVRTDAVSFLNWCAKAFMSNTTYYISSHQWYKKLYTGEAYFDSEELYNTRSIKFTPESTKYTVTFYETVGSNYVPIATMYSDGESNLAGWFDIDEYNISVNGDGKTAIEVNSIIDSISPFLITNKTYKCSDKYTFCGKTPDSIIKKIGFDGPEFSIYMTDGTVITLNKKMVNINGRLGIRLTPIITADDYPGCITIWQGRLCIGGSISSPNVVYMSKVNDYFDFTFFEDVEYTSTVMKPEKEWASPDIPEYETLIKVVHQTGADNAIQFSIMTEENEAIVSLCGGQHLFISTTTSEFFVPAGTTALNLTIQMVSRNGGSSIQSRFIQDMVTFIGNSKRRVYTFSPEKNIDLFNYSKHIITSDIIQIDYASDPIFEIYITLANGTVIRGMPSEGTMSWSRYTTSGNIKSTAVIRQQDEDAVYSVVIRGQSANVERLRRINGYEFNERAYLDSYKYIESETPLTTINRSIIPFPNGNVIHIHYLTDDGKESEMQVKLSSSDIIVPGIVKAFIGVPYNMVVKTWRIDTSDTEGIYKNVESIFFRLYKSSGFYLVKDNTEYFDVMIPDYDGINQILYDGLVKYNALSPWDTDKQVHIESFNGYPVNILNIMPQLATGEVV